MRSENAWVRHGCIAQLAVPGCALVVAISMAGAAIAQAAEPPPADEAPAQALAAPHTRARLNASAPADAPVPATAPEVAELLRRMDGDDPNVRKSAYETLWRLAQSAAGTKDQGAVAAELARELRGKHELETRREICGLLSYVGNDESLLVVYPLLGDADLREMAKFAIARVPGPGATLALVGALQIAERPFLVGVVNALADRGDPIALQALAAVSQHGDLEIRQAAWAGLAGIPSQLSFKIIREAVGAGEPGAVDGLLKLGAAAGQRGDAALARAVLDIVADQTDLNPAQQCRMLYLLPYRAPEKMTTEEMAVLLAKHRRQSVRAYGCVLDALIRLPGEHATRQIAALLAPDVRAAILKDAPGLSEERLVEDIRYVQAEREKDAIAGPTSIPATRPSSQ